MINLFEAVYDATIAPFSGPLFNKAIKAKEGNGIHYLNFINSSQSNYYSKHRKFATSIGSLKSDFLKADHPNYLFASLSQPDSSETITIAQSKQKELRSYIAVIKVVDLQKAKKGLHEGFTGVICVTDRPSMSPPNLPRYFKESRSYKCASGSQSLGG